MNKYRTTGERTGAAIIDCIVFIPFIFLNNYLLDILSDKTGPVFLWTLLAMFIFCSYSILLHGKFGQTIGKMLMGVKIVTYPAERPINYRQALIRDLPYILVYVLETCILTAILVLPELANNTTLAFVLLILGYANLIWVLLEIISTLFNEKRRAVHDFIARTVVIKVDSRYQPVHNNKDESI